MAERYDLAAIRRLVQESFIDDDFDNFCFDHFREVYRNARGLSFSQRIRYLIDYADTRDQVRFLLENIRLLRPDKKTEVLLLLGENSSPTSLQSPSIGV